MRLLALLGVLFFGLLTFIFYRWMRADQQRARDGELQMNSLVGAEWLIFALAGLTIVCLLYALGLWDNFVDWLRPINIGNNY